MDDERTHRYGYDTQHRLVHYERTQHHTPQVESRYVYDPLGRRIGKRVWRRERCLAGYMELSRKPEQTWYGWDGDRLTTTQTGARRVQTVYQPGSFTPLLRIETATAELARSARRSLAEVLQQDTGMTLPPELIQRLDRLEQEIQQDSVSEENRRWLAGCGLSVEKMINQMDPVYTPERKIHLYHCDHRGLPLALIDENGSMSWSAEYDEWGNLLNENNPHHLTQLIRLPGQQYDEESGLYYNRHRYYDPLLGQYITQDPIGVVGGWNLYSYVYNDPIGFVDPIGLDIWIEDQGPDEPALHQSINVGTPDGSYNSYSYAMGSFPHGEVYNDMKHGGKIEVYKKTTKEQDDAFDKVMKAQIGEHGYYGYDDICRSWSQRQFNSAPGVQETPPKRKDVKVTIGGFDLSSKGSSSTGSGTSR